MISKIRGKPKLEGLLDPDDFLKGASADVAENSKEVKKTIPEKGRDNEPPIALISKNFRLRWDIAVALEKAAQGESTPGRRVTQTDILEKVLKQYLKIKD